ncbi:homogentisate 1,2-dioxygenase, putative [Bodo saltans]|uniref:Homogentisate 1,2-dioxygenase, putative n=1 Tax=Bodo saltans TaxID=75058 RepID=A0A0S4JAM5_BODSA|nr:homogentisate 1,2-dioxygenase, putative [Bodo saltans]|eukprot:CUG87201.1 homogentisate 1,2-dioxygenase, putative [Bodo saltans]
MAVIAFNTRMRFVFFVFVLLSSLQSCTSLVSSSRGTTRDTRSIPRSTRPRDTTEQRVMNELATPPQSSSRDMQWYYSCWNTSERRIILERSLILLRGGNFSNSNSLGSWCENSATTGSTSSIIDSFSNGANTALRRPRVRYFMLPSSPIHTCLHTGMLVQTMQRNNKYVCAATDVANDAAAASFLTNVLPRVVHWIQRSLLIPAVELKPNSTTTGERTHPVKPDNDFGICEGQIGPYIPLSHDGRTSGTKGPANPHDRRYVYPSVVTSSSGADDTTYSVLPNTTIHRSSRTASRGTYHAIDGDVVLYITMMFSYFYWDANPCQFHPITGRPTVIHLNLDPGVLNLAIVPTGTSKTVWAELLSRYILRDVVQALALKNFFLDLNPTRYTRPLVYNNVSSSAPLDRVQLHQDEVFTTFRSPEGYDYNALLREPLLSITAAHFACNSTVGAALESINDVLYTTVNQNLAGRLFTFDLFTYDQLDVIMSDVMYGMMQSNGFWDVDWTTPVRETNLFGRHAGCTFSTKLCNETFPGRLLPLGGTWGLSTKLNGTTRRTVIVNVSTSASFSNIDGTVNESAFDVWTAASVLSNHSSLLPTPFCFLDDDTTLNTLMCHPLRRGVGSCNVGNYTGSLPPALRYFPGVPNMGGVYDKLLYCPIPDKNFVDCATVITNLYGDIASSPYSDFYCIDQVVLKPYVVQWPTGNTTRNVWKRVGSGCFRITECNPTTRTFSVRLPVVGSGNLTVSWPAVIECGGHVSQQLFPANNLTYHCPPYDSVCTSFYQKNPLLLPRDTPILAGDTDASMLPSMTPQRFTSLDVNVVLPNWTLASPPWWQASSVVNATMSIQANGLAAGWSLEATAKSNAIMSSTVFVPLSIQFSLASSGAAPFGGLLVVTTECGFPLSCAPVNASRSNFSLDEDFVNLQCWNQSTTPSCDASEYVPGLATMPDHCSASSPNQWVFFVDGPVVANTMYVTETVRCSYTMQNDDSSSDYGDPGEYLDVSFYALQPASLTFNSSSGLYQMNNATLQRNQSELLAAIRTTQEWLSPAAQPYCGNPLDVPAQSLSSSNATFSLQLVASAAHFNAVSDDLSPFLPSQHAAQNVTTPTSWGDFSEVLHQLWNGSSGAWQIPRTSASVVSLAVEDHGIITPNTTVTIVGIPIVPSVSVIALSLSATVTPQDLTASPWPSSYGLSYAGPVTPWWTVSPVNSSLLLMQANLLNGSGLVCNTSANILPSPISSVTTAEREMFASAAPCDSVVRIQVTFSGCSGLQDRWTTMEEAVFTDNIISSRDACAGAGAQLLSRRGRELKWSASQFPTVIISLDINTTLNVSQQQCSFVGVQLNTLVPVLLGGTNSTSRLQRHLVTIQQRFVNGSWAPSQSALTASMVLFPTATQQSDYALQLVYTASCLSCSTSLYYEFVLPSTFQKSPQRIRVNDTFVLRLDDTQYRRDQMIRHPWWNSSDTVLLGCSGLGLTVQLWMAQRIVVRVTQLQGSHLDACTPRLGKVGVLTSGYVTVSSSPTAASAVAEFHVSLNRTTVIYRTSASDASVSIACARCNFRGLCVGSTSCTCFVGYGGPACNVCASQNMSAAPNGQCAYYCDDSSPAAPVPPTISPRYKQWVAECIQVGGYLDPQSQCRCVCNGTFCFYPTATRSQSVTLTLMETPTVGPDTTSSPSPSGSSSPTPPASTTPSGRPSTTASPSGTGTTSPNGPTPTTTVSPWRTSTASPGSHTATNQPASTDTASPTGPIHTATPASSGTASSSPDGTASTSTTTSPAGSHTGTPATVVPTSSIGASSTTSVPGGSVSSTPSPLSTGSLPPTQSPSGWTASPTTGTQTPWVSGSPAPSDSTTLGPTPTGGDWTLTPSPISTPSTEAPSTNTNVPSPTGTPNGTTTPAPTPPAPTNHSWTTRVSASQEWTVTATKGLYSQTKTFSTSGELYPATPIVPFLSSAFVFFSSASSNANLASLFRGDSNAPTALVVSVTSALLEEYYTNAATVPVKQLLDEVDSPLALRRVTTTPVTFAMEVGGLSYRRELLASALVPIARYEDPKCALRYAASVPLDSWNPLWNETNSTAVSTSSSNATDQEDNTSWFAVPTADAKYVCDFFVYGPVFRSCFNRIQFSGSVNMWMDEKTLIVYMVVTADQLVAAAPPDESNDVRLLEVVQKAHQIFWCILAVIMLLTSPHLLLDAQLSALLAAIAMRSPGACVDGAATNIFSYLLKPYPIIAVVLPFSWNGEVSTLKQHLNNFWAHAAGLVFFFVIAVMAKVLSALRGWGDGSDLRGEAPSVLRKVFRMEGWVFFSQLVSALLATGIIFSGVSGLRAVEAGAETDGPSSIASLVLMPIALLLVCVMCATLMYFADNAIPSLDPMAPKYSSIDSLLRMRGDERSSKALRAELNRAAPKTLMWSKRLAVCVSVWFPPRWLLPRGYWTFPIRKQCFPRTQATLHQQRRDDRMREILTRWTPLIHVFRNIVVAALLALSGAESLCWSPSATTVFAPPWMQSGYISYRIGFGIAAAVVCCWVLFVIIVRPFRSVNLSLLSVWLSMTFVVVGAVMISYGTSPRGGVYSLSSVGTSTVPDDTPEGISSLLLATDAVATIVTMLLVLEHYVLDEYIEEVDRTASSQLQHIDALEACFLEVPHSRGIDMSLNAAAVAEGDALEMSNISVGGLGYKSPTVPAPIAPFSPLDALRKMVEEDAPRTGGTKAKGKNSKKKHRGGKRPAVLRREGSDLSDDDAWSHSGSSSGSSISLDAKAKPSPAPPAAPKSSATAPVARFNPLDDSSSNNKKRGGKNKTETSAKAKPTATTSLSRRSNNRSEFDFDALEAMLFKSDPLPPHVGESTVVAPPPLDREAAANLWKR